MAFRRPAVAIALVACLCGSCAGTSTPVSPTAMTADSGGGNSGGPSGGTTSGSGQPTAAPIGLTGVVRGLNTRSGTFSLISRQATRTILSDADTQVWNGGVRVRLSSLADGQTVSVRGHDYTRYVLARTISVN